MIPISAICMSYDNIGNIIADNKGANQLYVYDNGMSR